MENSMEAPQKIKNTSTKSWVILLLGIYPKKMKTLIHIDICIIMLLAALFAIARLWKQPKCPLIDKWLIYVDLIIIHMSPQIISSQSNLMLLSYSIPMCFK